jgi:Mevalonate pyrophosphate decarboxylase
LHIKSEVTISCVAEIENLRGAGHELFYTIDAGPQVKIICDPKSSKAIKETITQKTDVIEIVHAGIGGSPRVVNEN